MMGNKIVDIMICNYLDAIVKDICANLLKSTLQHMERHLSNLVNWDRRIDDREVESILHNYVLELASILMDYIELSDLIGIDIIHHIEQALRKIFEKNMLIHHHILLEE